MENKTKLGIWMDHSTAELIDLSAENDSPSIESKFTLSAKEEALQKSEHIMHNKEQQLQEAYYKQIAETILKYDHVLLFGPTDAKTELHNYLNKDSHFKHVKIDVEAADKMTDNQKHAFVKNHFNA